MIPDYASKVFEEKYTYHGDDLGAVWQKHGTSFRLWAPTAKEVFLNLYHSGDPEAEDRFAQIPMERDRQGTWVSRQQGDLSGVYYTFLVDTAGKQEEVCDPYAVTTGVNGVRAMVLNPESVNPPDWAQDKNPNAELRPTDAVIYELHIRDLSQGSSSGIREKGKFLGLIQPGTVNPDGISTGLDHIKSLGITHLHLLPFYDYGSVDERRSDQYNWGYDPVNYNVPEGSYSSDPYHGEVRVRELKQMIKGLHENGISVVMDVVYNHVFDADSFCINRIVPGYFSRILPDGTYSNGTFCGNDTASERSMVQKYIVDSVVHWTKEYHIDGFRFDLVGILDTDTVNAIMEAVHAIRPDVLFYGEGWKMNTQLTKPSVKLATQENAGLVPGFAFFSDTIRDLLRGSVFETITSGYASGKDLVPETLKQCIMGMPNWCPTPAQTVNYVSCHDNMTLFDQITVTMPAEPEEIRAKRSCFAGAINMLSQGIPFFQAGEEMLRSKPLPGGGFEENSYCSPDSVNSIRWDMLSKTLYRKTVSYYRGLIAFRKANPVLRLSNPEEVEKRIKMLTDLPENVAVFSVDGRNIQLEDELRMVFNPTLQPITLPLPEGIWQVYVQDLCASNQPLMDVTEKVTVSAISVTVLKKKPM